MTAALYNARKDKGWTQVQLAEKSGVSHGSVERFESGRRVPEPGTTHKLCIALAAGVEHQWNYLTYARMTS